jgi:hypothetical protein
LIAEILSNVEYFKLKDSKQASSALAMSRRRGSTFASRREGMIAGSFAGPETTSKQSKFLVPEREPGAYGLPGHLSE